jgi:hypothetical protein
MVSADGSVALIDWSKLSESDLIDSNESSESDETTELDSDTKKKNRIRRRQKQNDQQISSEQIVENQATFDLRKMVENAINTGPDLQQRQESKYFFQKKVSKNYRQTDPNGNSNRRKGTGRKNTNKKVHNKLIEDGKYFIGF